MENASEGPDDDLWRTICRLADGARLCLERHSRRMEADPQYREAVDHLAQQLCRLPSGLGKTVRIVSAGHRFLVKVM